MFGFRFPPQGWALCDGQLLPIAQNTALFSILGTTYGGDGRTTFALPDLRGRVAVHEEITTPLGARGGAERVMLRRNELPRHRHTVLGSDAVAQEPAPNGNVFARRETTTLYALPEQLVELDFSVVSNVGENQPHENMQPYLVVNYAIALQGVFPSRD